METIHKVLGVLLEHLSDYDKLKLLSTCKELNALKHTIRYTDIHEWTKVKDLNYKFRAIEGSYYVTHNVDNGKVTLKMPDIPVTHLRVFPEIIRMRYPIPEFYRIQRSKIQVTHVSLRDCYEVTKNELNTWLANLPKSVYYLSFADNYDHDLVIPPHVRTLVLPKNFNSNIDLGNVETVIFGEKFNKPITLPDTIRKIVFGFQFNQEVKLPYGVHTVKFGFRYNQPTKVPGSVRVIKFGDNFDSEVEFEEGPHTIKFSGDFDQPLTLPNSARIIRFNSLNTRVTIPPNAYRVVLGTDYSHHITIPPSVKALSIASDMPLPTLHYGLVELSLRGYFNKPVTGLPTSVQYLTLGNRFNSTLELHDGLRTLVIGEQFDKVLWVPDSVVSVTIRGYFNQPIRLSCNLQYLEIVGPFNQDLVLPETVKTLIIGGEFNQPLTLPKGIVDVRLPYGYSGVITNPGGVHISDCGINFAMYMRNVRTPEPEPNPWTC